MKTVLSLFTVLLLLAGPAAARDNTFMIDIAEALESDDFQEKLDSDIRFYFGKASHPAISKKRGEYVSNKKTNAFGKSDSKACNWAFLSAMLSLQDRAKAEGGNAVVNVRSYYKKNEFSSTTEVECHAGNVIAGVALIGEVVTLK